MSRWIARVTVPHTLLALAAAVVLGRGSAASVAVFGLAAAVYVASEVVARRDAIASLRADFENKQREMETAITALGTLLKRLEQELAQTRIAAGRR